MAKDHRDVVERGLELKKAGNEIMRLVGGRDVHPINLRVGGFYRAPNPARARAAGRAAEARARARARGGALERRRCRSPTTSSTTSWSRCRTPSATRSSAAGSPPPRGSTSHPREYDEHFVEEQVPHSNALHSRLRERRLLPVRAALALRAQLGQALPAGARGRRRGWARRRFAATRSRASSCARSRSSTPSTRRCGSSRPTSSPTAPPWR